MATERAAPAGAPHRPTKGEATHDLIVRAALAQAVEVGLEGVSLGVLAASLGLSKSGLFAHFKSKEALQLAVLDEAVERFNERVIIPALTRPRGEPRLRALFERALDWVDDNGHGQGCIFRSLAHEYDDRPGPIRDRLVESQRDWRRTVVRAVELAVREHHLDGKTDPELLAFELVGLQGAYHESRKLMDDPRAREWALRAYQRLVEHAQPRSPRR